MQTQTGEVFVLRERGTQNEEWRVRFNGRVCSPTWRQRGPADAYLAALADGTRKPEYSHNSEPYPHEGSCNGCRAEHRCNVCGRKPERFRISFCTNGRCAQCHGAVCTSGGDTAPGHGFGTKAAAERQWAKVQSNGGVLP